MNFSGGFSRAQLDRDPNSKFQIPKNIPTPNTSHIRLETFQPQSVFARLRGDLMSGSGRNGRRSGAQLRLQLTGAEAEVAALQSGGAFTAREEQRAAVEGAFLLSAVDNMFSLHSRPALTRGLIKHCAALKLAVGR